MDCVKEVINNELRQLYHIDYDVPVMVNCPCLKCDNVDFSDSEIVSMEDL